MCNTCNKSTTKPDCYEARLSLGLSDDKTMIVGTLDGVPIIPIKLKDAIRSQETNTNMKWDTDNSQIIFQNERFKNDNGAADFITARQILSGASIDQLGLVGDLIEGGLASVTRKNGELNVIFEVPQPSQASELPQGFVTYVQSPTSGSHYRITKPTVGSTSDTVLVGHPDGTIEFAAPVNTPILVPADSLTSSGAFNGAPNVSVGNWRYQTMGTTASIANSYGSTIEVTLEFRYSMLNNSTHSGVYCRLVDGGSDFKTSFVEGVSELRQESYPGGIGRFTCVLEPNQKCQFEFGGWQNNTGNMKLTIGSTSEDGTGASVETVYPPVISIRRHV